MWGKGGRVCVRGCVCTGEGEVVRGGLWKRGKDIKGCVCRGEGILEGMGVVNKVIGRVC